MLHVISLAQYAVVYTRSWAADSPNARVRLKVEKEQVEQDAALLREEIRIKDARMAGIPPPRRPYYPPAARMAILELRAARGWSLHQTADVFLVTAVTVASWMNRLDEAGPDALVQLHTPVNKFPDFVRNAVQRLKTLCPALGKKKLAQVLARVGLRLGATTVGRMRAETPKPHSPSPSTEKAGVKNPRVVTAKRPNHVWHVDLTAIPTQTGMWCSWSPWALPQCWPFCWWLALLLDHHSRRMIGFAVFMRPPTSIEIRAFLGRAIHAARSAPKYLISDKGSQFWPCAGYKRWCKRRNIRPRFGAIGTHHASIAVLERAIRTLKELLPKFARIPYRVDEMRQLIHSLVGWYNEFRPHSTLEGATPNESFFKSFPANRKPRIEPRPNWPRGSLCARPHALVAGKPGARFNVEVEHFDGQSQLPIIRLRRAASSPGTGRRGSLAHSVRAGCVIDGSFRVGLPNISLTPPHATAFRRFPCRSRCVTFSPNCPF